jgi:hypothetical protein
MKWGCGLAHIPFAGCIDLMQHSRIRVHTRLHELRIIELLLESNGPPLTSLGTVLEENSYLKQTLMKTCSLIVVVAVFMVFSHLAGATQAGDTTIRITGHAAGATPFISKLTLDVSNTSVLKSIQFTIDSDMSSNLCLTRCGPT